MSSSRDIRTLPLAQASISALLEAGFVSVGDLKGISPLDLRKETGISIEEALSAVQCVRSSQKDLNITISDDASINKSGTAAQPHQKAGNMLKRLLSDTEPEAKCDAVDAVTGIDGRDLAEQDSGKANATTSHPKAVSPNRHTHTSAAVQVQVQATEPITMLSLLSRIGRTDSIITFCRNLDKLMGGGVPLGQITEFVGIPGIGKTQLAMQLALDVQIPHMFSGVGGSAIYIDTEGSFWPQRAHNMAAALSEHLKKIAQIRSRGIKVSTVGMTTEEAKAAQAEAEAKALHSRQAAAAEITPERLLRGIRVFRVHSQSELVATVNMLSAIIERDKILATANITSSAIAADLCGPVRLIVIDSIAFHFRHDIQDTKTRARLLAATANKLHDIAARERLAVITTNHVTTRINPGMPVSNAGASYEVGIHQTVNDPSRAGGAKRGADGATMPMTAGSGSIDALVTGRYTDVGISSYGGGSSSTTVVPALGEQWAACLSNRVFLHWSNRASTSSLVSETGLAAGGDGSGLDWSGPTRTASVIKSASMPTSSAFFRICEVGVRDIKSKEGSVSNGAAPPSFNAVASVAPTTSTGNGNGNGNMGVPGHGDPSKRIRVA
jgi:RecA/RadA recombinase